MHCWQRDIPRVFFGEIARVQNILADHSDDHGIDKKVVIEEAGRAGFVLVNTYDFVNPDNVDYFLVFRPQ